MRKTLVNKTLLVGLPSQSNWDDVNKNFECTKIKDLFHRKHISVQQQVSYLMKKNPAEVRVTSVIDNNNDSDSNGSLRAKTSQTRFLSIVRSLFDLIRR